MLKLGLKILAATLALAIGQKVASADEDIHSANYWLQSCTSTKYSLRYNACVFYISGMSEDHALFGNFYCPPKTVTVGQKMAIVIRALQKEPEVWHLPFIVLASTALAEAFPCKKPAETGSTK